MGDLVCPSARAAEAPGSRGSSSTLCSESLVADLSPIFGGVPKLKPRRNPQWPGNPRRPEWPTLQIPLGVWYRPGGG